LPFFLDPSSRSDKVATPTDLVCTIPIRSTNPGIVDPEESDPVSTELSSPMPPGSCASAPFWSIPPSTSQQSLSFTNFLPLGSDVTVSLELSELSSSSLHRGSNPGIDPDESVSSESSSAWRISISVNDA
jgi:hypothetical protein